MRFGGQGLLTAIVFVVFLGSTPSFGQTPPFLDKDGLLPGKHDPANVPAADGSGTKVPAVPMSERMRKIITMFNAVPGVSNRNYDLVDCVDGLTFGFANHPQAKLADFFDAMQEDVHAYDSLVRRFLEAFRQSNDAWKAFARKAAINVANLDDASVRHGIQAVIIDRPLKNALIDRGPGSNHALQPRPESPSSRTTRTGSFQRHLAPSATPRSSRFKWTIGSAAT